MRDDRVAIVPALVLASVAAAWALYVVWAHAVLHWYADAWYVYPQLMNLSWERAVLLPENGHRLLVSQMLRWIDLHAFGGNQQLLRAVGIAWVSGVLFLLVLATARADGPRWLRAQVLVVLVLGVAWLGNARMLSHPYETVHVYLVMLLASNVGGHIWSAQQASMAAAQSAAALEGREPTAWGETVPSLLHAALPMARQHRVGPWADVPAAPRPPR